MPKTMRTAIATVALTLTLAGTSLAQPSYLTTIEQYCREEGKHAFYRGQERDQGRSVTDSLAYTRQHFFATGQSTAQIATWDWLTRWSYKHWQVSPTDLRQIAENSCLKRAEQTETTNINVRNRY